MAKKNRVHLLVAMTTVRDGKRVRLPGRTTQDLTAEEIKQLDVLTERTGKLHYRDPIDESGMAADDADEDQVEQTEAEKFVDRNANEITDDEIAALSEADRAAALEAEKAGRNRKTVIDRLTDGGL